VIQDIETAEMQLEITTIQYELIHRGPKIENIRLEENKIQQAQTQLEEATENYNRTKKNYLLNPYLKKLELENQIESLKKQIKLKKHIVDVQARLRAAESYHRFLKHGPKSEEIKVAEGQIDKIKIDLQKAKQDYQLIYELFEQHEELTQKGAEFKIKQSSRFNHMQKTSEVSTFLQELIIAQLDLQNAQKQVERRKELFFRKLVSMEDYDNDLYHLKQAAAALELVRRRARIELNETRYKMEATEANLRLEKAKLKLLNKNYDIEKVNRAWTGIRFQQSILDTAQSRQKEIDLLQIQLKLKMNSLGKQISLLQSDAEKELQDRSYAMKLAEVALHLSKNELKLLYNKYDPLEVKIAKSEVEKAKTFLKKVQSRQKESDFLKEDLALAQEKREEVKTFYELVKKELFLTQVRSPIDGIILTHDTKNLLGKVIQAGVPVMQVGDNNSYIIVAQIPEKEFPLVRVGQKAKIQITPFPKGEYKLFDATILTIGSAAEKNRQSNPGNQMSLDSTTQQISAGVFPVILQLERPYGIVLFDQYYEVKPGFSAEVIIITKKERILNLFFRRVLRFKGKFGLDRLQLAQDI